MIRFWRNTTAEAEHIQLMDELLSYFIGVTYLALFVTSTLLNLICLTYQCLNKSTISRRLFQLLALTDLVTSLYYPLYATFMSFKPDLLPQLASVGVVETMFLKLGSIPIYLSVVITSLLSITRFLGVKDPLSVKRGSIDKHFATILFVILSYTLAIVIVLIYSVTKRQTSLYRGAGLTVYFWDARVLVDDGTTSAEHPHLAKLTFLSLLLWIPAQLHCIAGFITSIRTILILRGNKKRLSQVHAMSISNNSFTSVPLPRSSPILSLRVHKRQVLVTSPTLINYVKSSPLSETSSASHISPSLANNRRGAITIFLMNIGNIVWFANFLMVLVFEFKREYFGFIYLDSARFMGRLFVPQILALLNPAIVIYRSSGIHASYKYYKDALTTRIRQRVNK